MTLDMFRLEKKVQPSIKASFVDDWLNKNFRDSGTKQNYMTALLSFVKSIYGDDVIDYNSLISKYLNEERKFLEDFKAFIQYLNNNRYAPSSINAYILDTKKFFSRHGHKISDDDWEDIRRGLLPANVTSTQDEILTKEQCKMLLSHFSILGKAIFLFLLSTGARVGETMQLRMSDFNLETDPPSVNIRVQYTKKGVGGRVMWLSYEARDAIQEWWKVKDTQEKRGGHGAFPKEMAFGIERISFTIMMHKALDKAGLAKRDPSTKHKMRIYHLHTLRKFFSTAMSEAGVPESIIHAWMGHKGYLDSAYKRYTKEKLAQIYKEHMDAVTVYGNIPSDFKQKLEAIEKEVKAKDEELAKVNEMLDKLGIPDDRPLEQRLLEYFKITQARQQESIPQPIKSEPRPLPKPVQKVEVETKPSTPEQPKKPYALETKPQWCPYNEREVTKGDCKVCNTLHFKIWSECVYKRSMNPNDPIFTPTKPKPIA